MPSTLDSLRRHRAPLVLAALTLFHLVGTLMWSGIDAHTVYWVPDDFAHLAGLQQLLTSMELGGVGAAVDYLREVNSHYSYLAHYPLALAALWGGDPQLAFLLANGLYFVALLVSTYHIGRLCHSRTAGLLAAGLVSLMPAAYGGWRTFGLDFPAMCLTALAMLTLLLAQGFSRRRLAAIFGVAAGVAALAKGQSLLFLFWPAAYELARGLVRARGAGDGSWRRVVTGGLLALGALALTTATWWYGRLERYASILGDHSSGVGMQELEFDTSLWGGVVYYAASFPLLTSGLLLLAALAVAPLALRHGKHRWTLALWIVVPLVLHVVLSVRHYRYLFPAVPAVAVVLAVGLCSLRGRRRLIVAGTTCAGALVLWFCCTFLGYSEPFMRENVREGQSNQVLVAEVPARQLLTARRHLPGDPVSFCLTCGPYRLVAPKPRAALAPHLFTQTVAMARRLARHHPGGDRVLLHYSAGTINHALQLQRLMPGLRMSLITTCEWGRYRQYDPPPGWAVYLLHLAMPGEETPVGRVVHSARIWKTMGDVRTEEGRRGHGITLQLVLARFDAGEEPPDRERFPCDWLPRKLGWFE